MEITVREYAVRYTVMQHGEIKEIVVRSNESGYVENYDLDTAGLRSYMWTNPSKYCTILISKSLPFIKRTRVFEFVAAQMVMVETEKVAKKTNKTIYTTSGAWNFEDITQIGVGCYTAKRFLIQ